MEGHAGRTKKREEFPPPLDHLPSLATDTPDRICVVTVVIVHVAIGAVEDPRIIAII